MNWADFHFIRPWWLLALVPAVLLVVLLCKRRAAGSGWDGLIASPIIQHLMVGRDERLARAPIFLLGLAWLLAVIALAGPTWERQPQAMYRASLDQVIVLDLSPSMNGTDIAPSRLARARFAISDLLSQTREGRSALVVFGAEHHVVTPLTDDAATVEQLLRSLSVDVLPVAGDRAASAMRAALQLLSAATSRAAHVILLSDGVGDPAESIAAAIELRAAGALLSVIGIGNERESQLRELARSGGGAYQPLAQLGEGRRSPALELDAVAEFTQTPGRELTADLWAEKGAWLLLPLLLLAALGYRRGWLLVLVVALFQQPQDAMAFDWDDLWLTPNQQAKRLLESGQPQQAAELFSDPQWQATARYQSGEYDEAAAQFAASDAAYNRANALARAGKLQEAIDSYDEALSAQPGDEDARFNRDLVQKLLDQQQQQQQQQGGEQRDSSQDQQEQGSGQDQQQAQDEQPSSQNNEQQDGEGQQERAQDSQPQQQAGRQEDSQQETQQEPLGESPAQPEQQQDEQQQSRQDVAPGTPDPSTAEQKQPAQPSQSDALTRAATEKELALEQWLRQVPDDPGGLLRRKFMLEHLQRRKESVNP